MCENINLVRLTWYEVSQWITLCFICSAYEIQKWIFQFPYIHCGCIVLELGTIRFIIFIESRCSLISLILFSGCARYPWLVLFVGLCVVVGLGHGIKYINVTTNPVELWASPNSRSRVEREYFDSHFEPFYRTEQVIIHASGYKSVSVFTFLFLF